MVKTASLGYCAPVGTVGEVGDGLTQWLVGVEQRSRYGNKQELD